MSKSINMRKMRDGGLNSDFSSLKLGCLSVYQ